MERTLCWLRQTQEKPLGFPRRRNTDDATAQTSEFISNSNRMSNWTWSKACPTRKCVPSQVNCFCLIKKLEQYRGIQIVLPGVQATIQSETGKRWVEVLSITAQLDWIDNVFQYGFAWQTFGVLREEKQVCVLNVNSFWPLAKNPGESQAEWDSALPI